MSCAQSVATCEDHCSLFYTLLNEWSLRKRTEKWAHNVCSSSTNTVCHTYIYILSLSFSLHSVWFEMKSNILMCVYIYVLFSIAECTIFHFHIILECNFYLNIRMSRHDTTSDAMVERLCKRRRKRKVWDHWTNSIAYPINAIQTYIYTLHIYLYVEEWY